jgi:hypothetical protein
MNPMKTMECPLAMKRWTLAGVLLVATAHGKCTLTPAFLKPYEQALVQKPKSAWSRYGLRLAKIHSGQTDAGRADLAAARALDPDIATRATRYGLTAAAP